MSCPKGSFIKGSFGHFSYRFIFSNENSNIVVKGSESTCRVEAWLVRMRKELYLALSVTARAIMTTTSRKAPTPPATIFFHLSIVSGRNIHIYSFYNLKQKIPCRTLGFERCWLLTENVEEMTVLLPGWIFVGERIFLNHHLTFADADAGKASSPSTFGLGSEYRIFH